MFGQLSAVNNAFQSLICCGDAWAACLNAGIFCLF
jgi:hypothetical protein